MTFTIPGYDAWKLRGPEERPDPVMETCETCGGLCWVWETGHMNGEPARRKFECPECEGTGEVEATPDEPDGDYLYEQSRDRRMEE